MVSLTGLTSTNDPGKNAFISAKSTVKPPFTLPVILPSSIFFSSKASDNETHALAFFAFSLDSLVSPNPSSIASTVTSTVSPSLTSTFPSKPMN